MWQQRRTHSWSLIIVGSVMLGAIALVGIVALANTIGLGRAIAAVVLGITIAAWVIGGAALIARGLNKM